MWASILYHWNVCLHHYRLIVFVMTLTFDLWPWKRFQQCPLTWWIFVASFDAICLLLNPGYALCVQQFWFCRQSLLFGCHLLQESVPVFTAEHLFCSISWWQTVIGAVFNVDNKRSVECQSRTDPDAGVGACRRWTWKLLSQRWRLHCILCTQHAHGRRRLILCRWSGQGNVHATLYQCAQSVSLFFVCSRMFWLIIRPPDDCRLPCVSLFYCFSRDLMSELIEQIPTKNISDVRTEA